MTASSSSYLGRDYFRGFLTANERYYCAEAMGLLDGQRAFITGGASGIGRATARMMAAEGARVAVADINGEGAKEVAGEIDGLAFEVDVTDLDAFQAAVREAAAAFGGLTVAFNNAGAGLLANVHEYTGE